MESVICCCKYYRTNVQELHSELTLFSCLTGFSLPSVLFRPVLLLGLLLSYVSLNRPGNISSIVILSVQAKHSPAKIANSRFVCIPFVRHKSIV